VYHIIGLLLITTVCGLVAGSYPSLYLSSFNPVSVLKGIKLKDSGAALMCARVWCNAVYRFGGAHHQHYNSLSANTACKKQAAWV
jgi:hypothetical protein